MSVCVYIHVCSCMGSTDESVFSLVFPETRNGRDRMTKKDTSTQTVDRQTDRRLYIKDE